MAAENPNRIQRIPQGWLSLFNIKSAGRNPERIDQELRATADIEKYYLAPQTIVFSQLDLNLQNPGDSSVVTVPSTETWLFLAGGLAISPGVTAGDTIDFSLFVKTNTAQNSCPIFNFVKANVAVTDRFDFGYEMRNPLVLVGGSTITWLLETTLTGAIGVTSRHLIARLP